VQNEEDIFDESIDDDDELDVEIPQDKRKNHSYKTKELDPRPPFQRGFVWDMKKASRLVESVLLMSEGTKYQYHVINLST
jgi:hypothetical protein